MEKYNFIVKTNFLLNYFNENSSSFPGKIYFMITLGALCGYTCQTASRDEQKSYFLVKSADKNYYFGRRLNYYLLESTNSFIILMKKNFEFMFKNNGFPDFVKILNNVASNIAKKIIN